jgi:hypothetical protein
LSRTSILLGAAAEKYKVVWIDIKGETVKSLHHVVEVENIVSQDDFDVNNLVFRDPNCFVAGSLSYNISEWKRLGSPPFILDWIENGVDIVPMFKHFKVNLKGKFYDTDEPVPAYFQML